jgi:hypothetical protein
MTRALIAAAALVAFAGSAEAAAKHMPARTTDDYKADVDAFKAADRNCPNDGEHNLVRDANDETKWVCLGDK